MPYDRLSDTHGTTAEIQKIKADRKKKNISDNKKGIKHELSVHDMARKPIATVAGTKQRMVALREELLKDGNTKLILAKVLAMALDDEHPGQVAAIKMCIDRMMPLSTFEDKVGGQRTAITISITGIGETKMNVIEGEVVDG